MDGKIDSTFGTFQRDMFESGLAAEIGANGFIIWVAIKTHADFNTGVAWPSIRRLAAITGLADKTVQKVIKELEAASLLRIVKTGNQKTSTRYIARERLDVKLGQKILCRIVIDYVPQAIKQQLHRISETLKTGERNPEAFSQVEIIPGEGFVWNPETGTLQGAISIKEMPVKEITTIDAERFAASALLLKMAWIQKKAKAIKN
jgi:DNA-binding transcriptional regulator YhcF (GntR family)